MFFFLNFMSFFRECASNLMSFLGSVHYQKDHKHLCHTRATHLKYACMQCLYHYDSLPSSHERKMQVTCISDATYLPHNDIICVCNMHVRYKFLQKSITQREKLLWVKETKTPGGTLYNLAPPHVWCQYEGQGSPPPQLPWNRSRTVQRFDCKNWTYVIS